MIAAQRALDIADAQMSKNGKTASETDKELVLEAAFVFDRQVSDSAEVQLRKVTADVAEM